MLRSIRCPHALCSSTAHLGILRPTSSWLSWFPCRQPAGVKKLYDADRLYTPFSLATCHNPIARRSATWAEKRVARGGWQSIFRRSQCRAPHTAYAAMLLTHTRSIYIRIFPFRRCLPCQLIVHGHQAICGPGQLMLYPRTQVIIRAHPGPASGNTMQ